MKRIFLKYSINSSIINKKLSTSITKSKKSIISILNSISTKLNYLSGKIKDNKNCRNLKHNKHSGKGNSGKGNKVFQKSHLAKNHAKVGCLIAPLRYTNKQPSHWKKWAILSHAFCFKCLFSHSKLHCLLNSQKRQFKTHRLQCLCSPCRSRRASPLILL